MTRRERIRQAIIGLGAAAACLLLLAQAAPPERLSYQGILRDASGAAVDGGVAMTLSLYDAPTGGTLLWQETYDGGAYPPQVAVSKGLFGVSLGDPAHRNTASPGSAPGFADVFKSHASVYLGVQVGTDAEMTPRIRMASAGYALNARSLDGKEAAEFAAAGHTHAASAITGTLATAQGGTGLASPGASGNVLTSNGTSWVSAPPPTGGGADPDAAVGNEVVDAADGTLARTGAGTGADPYKLKLNLGSANTWTGAQAFQAATTFPGGVWNAANNVGVGTASPATRLDVHGAVKATDADGDALIMGPGGTPGRFDFSFQGGAAATQNLLFFGGDAGNGFRMDRFDVQSDLSSFTGQVGVGTTSPQAALQVSSDSSSFGQFKIKRATAATGEASMAFYSGSALPDASAWVLGSGCWGLNDDFVLGQGSAKLLVQNSTGNVGIGTTAPGSRLDVTGDLHVSGALKDSSGGAGSPGLVLTSTGTGTQWAFVGAGTDADAAVGNEVVDAADATLSRTGTGTGADPFKLKLNLANANAWTGAQSFSANTTLPGGVWTSAGNVGLGTAAPASRLQVNDAAGAFYSTGGNADNVPASVTLFGPQGQGPTSQSSVLNVIDSTADSGENQGAGISFGGRFAAGSLYGIFGRIRGAKDTPTDNVYAGRMLFETIDPADGTLKERMRITSDGKLGIGTTKPFSRLSVSGPGFAGGGAFFESTDSANFVTIEGIGPGHLYSAALELLDPTLKNCEFIMGLAGTNGAGNGSQGDVRFDVGPNLEVMRLSTGRNVGIGTTNPQSRLDVEGDAHVSGALKDSSGSPGAPGQVLQSTGTGTQWAVAGGGADADAAVGNEVVDAADATLARTGAGTPSDPFKLKLNLASANAWTGAQSFSADTVLPGGIWRSSGSVGIGTGTNPGSAQLEVQQVGLGGQGTGIRSRSTGAPWANVGIDGIGDASYSPAANDPIAVGVSATAIGAQPSAGSVMGLAARATSYSSGDGIGVYSYADSNGTGRAFSIYGDMPGGTGTGAKYAGYFNGRVAVTDNLGVGTVTPGSKLEVAGDARIDEHELYLRSGTDVNHGLGWYGNGKPFGSATPNGPVLYGWDGGALGSMNGGPSPALTWNYQGCVGIGTTKPGYLLQLVSDSAAKPGTNTWTIASDARLKKDVAPFTDGLGVIEGIHPVRYRYNGLGGTPKDMEGIGVLAQDIKEVAPYTVGTFKAKLDERDESATDLYDFNSHALTFVLINAVKELDERTRSLVSREERSVKPERQGRGGSGIVHGLPGGVSIDDGKGQPPAPGVGWAPALPGYPVCEPVEAGDVLVADATRPGTFCLGRQASDGRVVGIVAGEVPAGASGRGERAALAPLATSGLVTCKVDAAYGPIQVGDLLVTCPTPGHAMKALNPAPGTVLGKALQPLESGTGLIQVLVMLR